MSKYLFEADPVEYLEAQSTCSKSVQVMKLLLFDRLIHLNHFRCVSIESKLDLKQTLDKLIIGSVNWAHYH